MKPFKELTDFFQRQQAVDVPHTGKGYLAHAIGVYNDLKKWGCEEELANVGLFHSIYGTEIFQNFTFPVEQRDEIRELIGERAENLCYWNCGMVRETFDAAAKQSEAPYVLRIRFTDSEVELTEKEFNDLCTIHLCDWLEQVPRCKMWDYRTDAYSTLANRLSGVAKKYYDEVYALAK